MDLSQKVAFNTLVQIAAKIFTATFGLLITIILTRYLGRSGFGDYVFVLTYVMMFGSLADWGTALIGVREASANEVRQKEILGNVFLLRLVFSFSAAILAIFLIYFLPLRVTDPVLVKKAVSLGALLVIFFATKASFGIAFQTRLCLERLAITDILISLLSFGLSLIAVRQNWGLIPLIMAIIFANIIGLLVALSLARKMIKFSIRPDWGIIKNLLKETIPMGGALILFTVYNRIDTIILASVKGSQAVGIYGVAYRIHDVLILGAAYFLQSLLPVLSCQATTNFRSEKFKHLYQKAFDILVLMAIPMLILVLIFAPLMVRIIGGKEFIESAIALRILIFATFVAYFNHLTGFTIIALKKQQSYFFITFAALVLNVIANLILIPKFSYKGAAFVTFMTEGLVFLITTIFIFRLVGIFPSLTKFPQTAVQLIKSKGIIF